MNNSERLYLSRKAGKNPRTVSTDIRGVTLHIAVYFYLFIYSEIHSFICSTREILKTSVCNMKSDRHQGNALTDASIKMTNTRYNKCKNPDKSELLTKDLKVAVDCTVSTV